MPYHWLASYIVRLGPIYVTLFSLFWLVACAGPVNIATDERGGKLMIPLICSTTKGADLFI